MNGYQIGNMMLMVVGAVSHPDSSALSLVVNEQIAQSTFFPYITAERRLKLNIWFKESLQRLDSGLDKVALLGYTRSPYYTEGHAKNFGDFGPVYRADNLAALGVGQLIGWKLLALYGGDSQKLHQQLQTPEGKDVVIKQVEGILREVFSGTLAADQELTAAVNYFKKFQPADNAPDITLDALTFRPEYGGFNTMSLRIRREEYPISRPNSIAAESAAWEAWKRQHGGLNWYLNGGGYDRNGYEEYRHSLDRDYTTPKGF